MNEELLRETITLLKSGVDLSPLALAVQALSVLVVSGLGAYAAERLKGVATKADVADITRIVEDVRAMFAQRAAEQEQRYRLQLAALDRRLEVLQQAYVQWWRLYDAVYTPRVHEIFDEAHEWYRQHCIYLGREVAIAFWEAARAARIHLELTQKPDVTDDAKRKNWEKLASCGDKIAAAAGLPPIGHLSDEPTAAPA